MVNFNKLRGLMTERNVSQNELARRLGCSRQTVNNKMNGKNPFTLRDVTEICDAINATPDERNAIFFE